MNKLDITLVQIDNMKHSLGWNYDTRLLKRVLNSYRNYWYTTEKEQWAEELCNKQLMVKQKGHNSNGIYYHVTTKGIKLLENICSIKIKQIDKEDIYEVNNDDRANSR